MAGRFEYRPRGDVVMLVECKKATTKTCRGETKCFEVTRRCSHGCKCTGNYITNLRGPDLELVKDFAPCGNPGLCIRGPGRDARLTMFQNETWHFEMTASLFAKEFTPAREHVEQKP